MKHVKGRVVIKLDLDSKNFHVFSNGAKIIMERDWNNFNYRSKSPVQGEVVSADNITIGATILLHHNSVQETYLINDHTEISGQLIADRIRYYSVPEENCYIWRDVDGKWKPLKNFVTGLRVFKPYTGVLHGVAPVQYKNCLYITSGVLAGKIVRTLKASDYEIIFQGDLGREERIIRCRYFPEDPGNIRNEIIAIDNELTDECKKGRILVGLTTLDAKPIT